MAETGKTNTYDPDVSWHFHESYYSFNDGIAICECKYSAEKDRIFKNYVYADTYSFRRDEFGDNTYELVLDFASNFGYEVVNSDHVIVVLATDCHPRYDLSTWSSNPDVLTGEIFYDNETFIDDVKTYAEYSFNKDMLPGKNYTWEGEVNVEPTPEPTLEPTTSPDPTGSPEPTTTPEPTGSPDPGGNDPGSETGFGTGTDIDTIDDVSEILREIYKQDTLYYTDALETTKNSFDVQVVQLSVSFVTVFLCGVLVGCAFARSLWHKMNAG